MARTSKTLSNKNAHLCAVFDLTGKAFRFSLLNMMLTISNDMENKTDLKKQNYGYQRGKVAGGIN